LKYFASKLRDKRMVGVVDMLDDVRERHPIEHDNDHHAGGE
jgi:hypothetical protein